MQGKEETDRCPHCVEQCKKEGRTPPQENQRHIWWECPAWKDIRQEHIAKDLIKPDEWDECWTNAGLLIMPQRLKEIHHELDEPEDIETENIERHPEGEDEHFEGFLVEVFSDGSVRAPPGRHFAILRRAGGGASWGENNSKNFHCSLQGPVQTMGRAELNAAVKVLAREIRALLLRIDNQWVVDCLQILAQGVRPDPLWEHIDLWEKAYELIGRRTQKLVIRKVKGHIDEQAIKDNIWTRHEQTRNDQADALAKKGAGENVASETLVWMIQDMRRWAMNAHRMMIKIALQRADIQKEWQKNA